MTPEQLPEVPESKLSLWVPGANTGGISAYLAVLHSY